MLLAADTFCSCRACVKKPLPRCYSGVNRGLMPIGGPSLLIIIVSLFLFLIHLIYCCNFSCVFLCYLMLFLTQLQIVYVLQNSVFL